MNKELTDSELRLKRLKFRSWHRGWKENDLILGSFADAKLASLTPAELDAYEALLEEDDDIVWGWIVGKIEVPAQFTHMVEMLKTHSGMA